MTNPIMEYLALLAVKGYTNADYSDKSIETAAVYALQDLDNELRISIDLLERLPEPHLNELLHLQYSLNEFSGDGLTNLVIDGLKVHQINKIL